MGHGAEQAGLHDVFPGIDQVRRAAPLRADLDHPLVPAGGGEHGLPLGHIDADRLLDIHIGAGLDGGDHRQGMPVIGRGDENDVQVLLFEHLAVIAVRARLLLRCLASGDEFGCALQHPPVHVADRDDFDRGHLDQAAHVGLAVPARADDSDAKRFLLRAVDEVPAEGRCNCAGRSGLQKLATVHVPSSARPDGRWPGRRNRPTASLPAGPAESGAGFPPPGRSAIAGRP